MTLKNSLALHAIFWIYLLTGSAVFYVLEQVPSSNEPTESNGTARDKLCTRIANAVTTNLKGDHFQEYADVILRECANLTAKTATGTTTNTWDYSSALFLAVTLVTTIGYGNVVPNTVASKIFCIVYGFVGIPLAGILLASTSNYFSNRLFHLYNQQRRRYHNEKLAILAATVVYLIPGLVIFVFIPAEIFKLFEQWSHLDAIYFSFVSLTTIGFGDYVAAQNMPPPGIWLYRLGLICWINVGLGYWAVIVGFIMKAFKSKELRKKWQRTAEAILHQAEEMRKAIELSKTNSRQDEFLPFTSRALFCSVFELAGTIARVNPQAKEDLDLRTTSSVPKPQRGIFALMSLPGLVIGHQRHHQENETPEVELEILSGSKESLENSPNEALHPNSTSSLNKIEIVKEAMKEGPVTDRTLKELLVSVLAILEEMERRNVELVNGSKRDDSTSGVLNESS